jgi:hypothetical protein
LILRQLLIHANHPLKFSADQSKWYNKLSKQELADFFHIQYIDNDWELKVIHEFEQDYDQNRVSLARCSSIYRKLASRRQSSIKFIGCLTSLLHRCKLAKILSVRYFIAMLSLPIEHRRETNPVKTRNSPVEIFKKYLHFTVSFFSKTVYERISME